MKSSHLKLLRTTIARTTAAGSLILSLSLPAMAEDVNTIFQRVNDLIKSQNYAKALNELDWAKKEIEKLHGQRLKTFFPDELAGFKGGQTEVGGALGFMTVERSYTDASNNQVKVSLMGGSGGGGPAGLGGLAQLGQMAAMFGGQEPGKETLRIGGRTAMLDTTGSSASLDVFLDGGSFLKFEQSGKGNGDSLKAMAEAIKIDDIEKYLKGNS